LNLTLDFCFDAFSSREPVSTERVIGRAFARPVGLKTLESQNAAALLFDLGTVDIR
jgi:hypothetical protein